MSQDVPFDVYPRGKFNQFKPILGQSESGPLGNIQNFLMVFEGVTGPEGHLFYPGDEFLNTSFPDYFYPAVDNFNLQTPQR